MILPVQFSDEVVFDCRIGRAVSKVKMFQKGHWLMSDNVEFIVVPSIVWNWREFEEMETVCD